MQSIHPASASLVEAERGKFYGPEWKRIRNNKIKLVASLSRETRLKIC